MAIVSEGGDKVFFFISRDHWINKLRHSLGEIQMGELVFHNFICNKLIVSANVEVSEAVEVAATGVVL